MTLPALTARLTSPPVPARQSTPQALKVQGLLCDARLSSRTILRHSFPSSSHQEAGPLPTVKCPRRINHVSKSLTRAPHTDGSRKPLRPLALSPCHL